MEDQITYSELTCMTAIYMYVLVPLDERHA